jgi:PhnB protein
MTVLAVTHLNFRGDAHAALAFYQSVFGGNQMVITYKDAGNVQNPAEADQIRDTVLHFGAGNAADEISSYWQNLSEGATVLQPLAPSDWSPLYGMLKDRFGVTWVLDVEVTYAAAS